MSLYRDTRSTQEVYKCVICGQPKHGHICQDSGQDQCKWETGWGGGWTVKIKGQNQQMFEQYVIILDSQVLLKTAKKRSASAECILDLSHTNI
jgi:hypothetical protein